MNKIILDGRDYTSKDAFHKDMKKKFDFPDYYGKNLDALWDLLSEKNDLNIELKHSSDFIKNLGDYGKQIINLFRDLKEEGFTIKIEEHSRSRFLPGEKVKKCRWKSSTENANSYINNINRND